MQTQVTQDLCPACPRTWLRLFLAIMLTAHLLIMVCIGVFMAVGFVLVVIAAIPLALLGYTLHTLAKWSRAISMFLIANFKLY